MDEKNILDHTSMFTPKASHSQKIALFVELALWAFIVFNLYRFLSYDVRSSFSSIGNMFGNSAAPLYAYFILLIFYLLFATLIFRSQGWKQHVLAHICGLIMSIYLVGIIFKLESWPWANGMLILAFIAGLIFSLIALINSVKSKDKQLLNLMFNIFIRMGFVTLLTIKPVIAFILK